MMVKFKPFFKGFLRAFAGSCVSAMFALSGYGFSQIPQKDGYAAVILCSAASLFLILGVVSLYKLGGGKPQARSGKYSK